MHTNARQFRERFAKHGLERARCDDCGRVDDPSAGACYRCGSGSLSPIELTPRGEVVTFVVQHHLPEEFDTPLPIGLVETPEGGKLLGMFTAVDDPHDIEVGETVDVVLKRFARDDGQVLYEPKFRRTDPGGAGEAPAGGETQ